VEGEGVFVGGLDGALGCTVGNALTQAGVNVQTHSDPHLQGREPENICNRGTSGAGVQLELSKSVRETLFESLLPEGRTHPTPRFRVFVDTVRAAIG